MLLVHGVHRPQNGAHQVQGLPLGKHCPGAAHAAHQGLPRNIVHDQIGGAVLLQSIPPGHDALHSAEASHQLPLAAEGTQRFPEGAALLPGQGKDLLVLPTGQAVGEKLLDGHRSLLIQIHGQIGNAEAAGPQPGAQQIPPRQNGEGGQGAARRRQLLPGETAAGAGDSRIRPVPHAPRTQVMDVYHDRLDSFSSSSSRSNSSTSSTVRWAG